MNQTGKVLVVGGGIGGFSTAIALHDRGIAVEIIEINTAWKVYHVGIIVQSNFVRALAQIGVAEQAVAAGYPYKGWLFRDNAGNELARSDGVSTAGPQFPADLGLARPALHEVLLGKVRELGIPVRQGVTWYAIRQDEAGVDVDFTDGTSGRYDLLVGADGAYSKLREMLFEGRYKPEYFGQGVWRYNLPRPAGLEYAEAYIGDPTRSIGTVPLTDSTMYIFISVGEEGNPKFPPETLATEMRKRLSGYGELLDGFANQITDPELVVYRPLEVCVLPDPWYKGRIVLIGDAAHSATPHLGQGAAMAVEDAVVLAAEYAGEGTLDERLRRFMNRRFKRAAFIAESSMQLGRWQLNPGPEADPIGLYDRVRDFIGEPI